MDPSATTSKLTPSSFLYKPERCHFEINPRDLPSSPSSPRSYSIDLDEIRTANEEDHDQFFLIVNPPGGQVVVMGETEETASAKSCKDVLIDCLPVCPPTVCGILKGQLLSFIAVIVIIVIFFLIYWLLLR
ncbi:hypothetical protein JTB14_011187 [Gonioctena quinquepunctata]|nr:hypothetical protein JTB14_011187 [Gonioctena quinquepunctata]